MCPLQRGILLLHVLLLFLENGQIGLKIAGVFRHLGIGRLKFQLLELEMALRVLKGTFLGYQFGTAGFQGRLTHFQLSGLLPDILAQARLLPADQGRVEHDGDDLGRRFHEVGFGRRENGRFLKLQRPDERPVDGQRDGDQIAQARFGNGRQHGADGVGPVGGDGLVEGCQAHRPFAGEDDSPGVGVGAIRNPADPLQAAVVPDRIKGRPLETQKFGQRIEGWPVQAVLLNLFFYLKHYEFIFFS